MEIKKIKKKVIIFTDLDETLLKENKFNHNSLNNFIKITKNKNLNKYKTFDYRINGQLILN